MQSKSVLLKNMFDPEESVHFSWRCSHILNLVAEKLNATGTRTWRRTSKVNAKRNMARSKLSKLRRRPRLVAVFSVIR